MACRKFYCKVSYSSIAESKSMKSISVKCFCRNYYCYVPYVSNSYPTYYFSEINSLVHKAVVANSSFWTCRPPSILRTNFINTTHVMRSKRRRSPRSRLATISWSSSCHPVHHIHICSDINKTITRLSALDAVYQAQDRSTWRAIVKASELCDHECMTD